MRRAMARAAIRRGCSRMTGPSSTSAGGTRVVLPAPWRRRQHQRATLPQRDAHLIDVRVYWQGIGRHRRIQCHIMGRPPGVSRDSRAD